MTIAERLLRTRSWTARHILQDEAAMFGAQAQVEPWLETELAVAEAIDQELERDIAEPEPYIAGPSHSYL